MKIEWLGLALRDLLDQAEYIAQDDPDAAKRLVTRVYEAVDRLSHHPGIGGSGRIPGTRELVVSGTRLVIPYRVRENRLEILRVFHGSQRPPESVESDGSNGRTR